MSKTFKGFASDRELTVKGYDDGSQVELLVRRSATGLFDTGIAIAPSDVPALALAVLEAAGYGEEYEGGNCWAGPLGQAMHMLRLEAEAQERATAEARERAELEAEALELHNAFWDGWDRNRIDSWDDQPGKAKNAWVSAARRARELAKEATK